MAIIRREDGLYDIPELGLQGVPQQYIPTHRLDTQEDLYNQQAVPPPPAPDMRLANAEGGSTSTQNYNSVPAKFNAQPDPAPAPPPQGTVPQNRNDWGSEGQSPGYSAQQVVPQTPPEPEASPNKLPDNEPLSAPPEPGTEGSSNGKKAQGDPALASFLLQYMHGTPPTVIPEHLAKTAESWTQHDLKAPPGTTTERKDLPDDALPVYRDVQVGVKNGKPVYEKKLVFESMNDGRPEYHSATQETPNDVITEGAKAKSTASADETVDQATGQTYKAASRNMDQGNVLTDQAAREQASVQNLAANQAKEQADYNKAMDDFRASLNNINRLATQAPPDAALGRKLTLGLAQGLVYAGAAAAGQQVPHLDWIGEQIRLDVEKQRMQLEAGVHVAGLKLNALQALRQHATSPEAAQHMLAMADYTAAIHMVDGMVREGASYEMIDKANMLKSQLAEKRDKEAELATEAEHISQTQRIPRQVVAGSPAGYPGLRKAAQALFKEPKAQDEAVSRWADQIGRGEMPTMPTDVGAEGQQLRAKETIAANRSQATIQLDPTITGQSGTAYGGNDVKLVHEAKMAQVQGRAIINSFETLRDEAKRVGSKTVDRTTVAKIDIELQALEAKLLVAAKEGNTESKVEAMKVRSAREYLQKMSIADTNEVIDFAENSALGAINSLIPLDQFTWTYRGDDYVRNNKHEAKRVRK